jgi:hypothetical protein
MNDTVSAGKKMVKDFAVVTPDTTVKAAEAKLRAKKASYCVIQTSEGEPLAVVTNEQLSELPDKAKSLSDELPNLPEAVPVKRDQLLSDIVQTLSPFLLGSRPIKGLIVLYGGKVVGILARQLIKDYALASLGLRSISSAQVEGDPNDPPPNYFCPLGDYNEQVVSYDRLNPPYCPNHNIPLVRKKK